MILHTGTSLLPPPGVALPLAAAAVLYVRGASRVRGRTRGAWFIGAWAVLGLALATPLHELGRSSLTLHMVQHVLLMSVAAPLLVWSRPTRVLLRGLPGRARGALIRLLRALQPLARALTGLVAATLVHGLALWTWHVPALYSRAATNALVHGLQHLSLLGTALLYWAAVAAALSYRGHGLGALLSLFLTTLHTGLLGALLTFSRVPWYAAYAGGDAVADQQLAGLVMWVPGALPYLAAALVLLVRALAAPAERLPDTLRVEIQTP